MKNVGDAAEAVGTEEETGPISEATPKKSAKKGGVKKKGAKKATAKKTGAVKSAKKAKKRGATKAEKKPVKSAKKASAKKTKPKGAKKTGATKSAKKKDAPRRPRKVMSAMQEWADVDPKAKALIKQAMELEATRDKAATDFTALLPKIVKATGGAPSFNHPKRGPVSIMVRGDKIFWRAKPTGKTV